MISVAFASSGAKAGLSSSKSSIINKGLHRMENDLLIHPREILKRSFWFP
jgi:hypothetical protein